MPLYLISSPPLPPPPPAPLSFSLPFHTPLPVPPPQPRHRLHKHFQFCSAVLLILSLIGISPPITICCTLVCPLVSASFYRRRVSSISVSSVQLFSSFAVFQSLLSCLRVSPIVCQSSFWRISSSPRLYIRVLSVVFLVLWLTGRKIPSYLISSSLCLHIRVLSVVFLVLCWGISRPVFQD